MSNYVKMTIIAAALFLVPAFMSLLIPKQKSGAMTFMIRSGSIFGILVFYSLLAGGGDAFAYVFYIALFYLPVLLLVPGFDLLKEKVGTRPYAIGILAAAVSVAGIMKLSGMV